MHTCTVYCTLLAFLTIQLNLLINYLIVVGFDAYNIILNIIAKMKCDRKKYQKPCERLDKIINRDLWDSDVDCWLILERLRYLAHPSHAMGRGRHRPACLCLIFGRWNACIRVTYAL